MQKNSSGRVDIMAQSKLVPVYCIDTSSLINLKNFPRDIFPTIWEKIDGLVNEEQLISPTEVHREITQVKDGVYKWCTKHKKIFVDPDQSQAKALPKVKAQYDKHHWDVRIQKPGAWADP